MPSVNSGRFKSRYRTAVRNDGNAEQTLYPVAIDDSSRLRTSFAAGPAGPRGRRGRLRHADARPRFPKLVGRITEHRVGVDVAAVAPEVEEPELSAKEKLKAKAKEQGVDAKGKAKGMVKVSATGVAIKKPRIPTLASPAEKFKPDPGDALAPAPGPADAAAPITARQVVFRQKPVIPLWLSG